MSSTSAVSCCAPASLGNGRTRSRSSYRVARPGRCAIGRRREPDRRGDDMHRTRSKNEHERGATHRESDRHGTIMHDSGDGPAPSEFVPLARACAPRRGRPGRRGRPRGQRVLRADTSGLARRPHDVERRPRRARAQRGEELSAGSSTVREVVVRSQRHAATIASVRSRHSRSSSWSTSG